MTAGGRRLRLAFVVPRYGEDIAGGAETLCRDYAERLLGAGHDVQVLTTCAVDHFTWANAHPEGTVRIRGVPVHRHAVTEPKDPVLVQRLEAQLAAGRRLHPADEAAWVRSTGSSDGLMRAIARVADSVDALVFMPYLFASTGFGAAVRPDRSIVVPCLHDEPYARFSLLQSVLRGARGLVFNSDAEAALAAELLGTLPPHGVAGGGVDLDVAADGDRFRRRHDLTGDAVCYAGRREPGKSWPLLVEWMTLYARALSRRGPATLLSMGHGSSPLPCAAAGVVRDLGFVDGATKLDAMAASTVTAQLSRNESFSYVLFESWMAGTPVLVHAAAAVTREHCERSGGGLWVAGAEQFAAALDRLRGDATLRAELAAQGRAYAAGEYAWPRAIDRLVSTLTAIVDGSAVAA